MVLFDRHLSPAPYDIFLSFLGIDEASVRIKAVHNQSGMQAKMLQTPGSFTFASIGAVPAHVAAVPLDPPVATSYWVLARTGDEALVERFRSYVEEY